VADDTSDAKEGLPYISRRADTEGQSFTFRAENTGAYLLKFYKQDFIRDYILNDHVRVIVEGSPGEPGEPDAVLSGPVPGTAQTNTNTVVAGPRWPAEVSAVENSGTAGNSDSVGNARGSNAAGTVTVAPGSAAGTGGAANAGSGGPLAANAGQTAPGAAVPGARAETQAAEAENLPEALLRQAREEHDAGKVADALATLEKFRERFPLGSDEAWWLYGQLLEKAGPDRDVKKALEYYRRLVDEYPQSKRGEDAKRRIAYLERFYFNIR
jgi:tetratricopeptide (TPR) repeat protein